MTGIFDESPLVVTHLELADGLEFHGLASEVLLWRDHVRKDVQEERTGAWSMHSECHNISDDRLEGRN